MNSDQAGKTAEECLKEQGIYPGFTSTYAYDNMVKAILNYHSQFKRVEESDKDREIIEKMADNGFAASEAIMFGEWMLKNQLKPDYYSQELMWGNHDVRLKFGNIGYTTTAIYQQFKKEKNLL